MSARDAVSVERELNKMRKETKEERAERKAIWMGRATAHFDTPKIRKEASEKWEEANKIEE